MNPQLEAEFDEYLPFRNPHGRNDRFQYAKVKRGGHSYFLKIATDARTRTALQREAVWPLFMDTVVQKFPDEQLRSPEFIEFVGDSAALFEYIDAPVLMIGNNSEAWRASIDRYARMLYVLDEAAADWTSELLPTDRHRTEEYEEDWRQWLEHNADPQDQDRFEKALQMVANYSNRVSTRMQHGDLTPWQMFNDNGEWIIYDGETCGTDLARYNDLAYGYGRLATKLRAPDVAAQLLQSFLEQSNTPHDEFYKQFGPVMTGRAMGMLADAYVDKATDDYLAEARTLLDLCLEGSLERLLLHL